MADQQPRRRAAFDLWIVQVLSTGFTLPVLSMFTLRFFPPGIVTRLTAPIPPPFDLGLPPQEDVVLAATRQAEGLGVLAGVALLLAALMLLVGCATAATLVHRAGIGRREELGIRAAVGASPRDLRDLVIAPLTRLLLIGAASGIVLGSVLLVWVRMIAPAALTLPAVPVSPLTAVSILAPPLAAWWGARIDLRAVLRRFASPLTLQSSTRLAPLGFGGAYFGLLVGLLATLGTLASGQSYADVAPQDWAEARDTLLFELEEPGVPGALAAVDVLRERDPNRPWHLVSSGALEGMGASAPELTECDCLLGLMISPYRRLYAQRHSVTPGAFGDLGIRVMRGREFSVADGPESEGVVMIDAGHLPRYVGQEPVGKLMRISGTGLDAQWYRIIGVVDVPKPLDLATRDRPIPGLYFSALQHPPSRGQLVTRLDSEAAPASTGGTTRDAEAAVVAAGVAARPLGSLADRLAMWAEPLPWFGILVGIVSIGALVVGIYGVATLSWLNVRSRTTEFGVRRAVGARSRHIGLLVLREVAEIGVVGAAMGSILGVGLTVGLADRYRAVEGIQPLTLAAVVGALALAAVIASRSPARRAVRITPIEAIGDVSAD